MHAGVAPASQGAPVGTAQDCGRGASYFSGLDPDRVARSELETPTIVATGTMVPAWYTPGH